MKLSAILLVILITTSAFYFQNDAIITIFASGAALFVCAKMYMGFFALMGYGVKRVILGKIFGTPTILIVIYIILLGIEGFMMHITLSSIDPSIASGMKNASEFSVNIFGATCITILITLRIYLVVVLWLMLLLQTRKRRKNTRWK